MPIKTIGLWYNHCMPALITLYRGVPQMFPKWPLKKWKHLGKMFLNVSVLETFGTETFGAHHCKSFIFLRKKLSSLSITSVRSGFFEISRTFGRTCSKTWNSSEKSSKIFLEIFFSGVKKWLFQFFDFFTQRRQLFWVLFFAQNHL